MTKSTPSQSGLTLFEILIIIVLVMMLALGSYLGFNVSLAKGRDSVRKADLEKVKGALYDYFMDTNCFPDQLPGCGEELKAGEVVYFDNFPCSPDGSEYGYQSEDSTCSQWFKVLTNLENEQDSGIEKVGCNYGCGPNCDYNYGLSSSNIKVNNGCVTYLLCLYAERRVCRICRSPSQSMSNSV